MAACSRFAASTCGPPAIDPNIWAKVMNDAASEEEHRPDQLLRGPDTAERRLLAQQGVEFPAQWSSAMGAGTARD